MSAIFLSLFRFLRLLFVIAAYRFLIAPGRSDSDYGSSETAYRRARNRGELPPVDEERQPTEFDQRRLEILKQAAWHAKLRVDKRSKM